ncbi:hypothetical protein CUMW_106290 [Citrus unshiu]|nr:hypothetical protein CUMW_106290 [Citrus unshiu]
MRYDSWQPFPVPREQELLSFYCWSITLPNTRNWGTGVRGKYIEETRRDEQVSGGRVLRAGRGEETQSTTVGRTCVPIRELRHEVRLHSPTMAIMGRPHPRVGRMTGRTLKNGDYRKAIRSVASVPGTFISDLSVGGFTPEKQPACSDLFLWTQEYLEKKAYEERS